VLDNAHGVTLIADISGTFNWCKVTAEGNNWAGAAGFRATEYGKEGDVAPTMSFAGATLGAWIL
jgi:hypothetical protein